MAYTPTTWTDNVTDLSATNMNHLETGVSNAATTADAAIPAPIGPAANAGLVWNGSSWVAAKLVDANIDAAAAIVYSKLSLAGSIINNDVSVTAAIAISKLADPGTGKVIGSSGGSAAAITPSWSQIADTTLAASATSFDFTSIPGTYNHLVIRGVLRTDEVASLSSPTVRFNNDSGATYDTQEASGQGVTAGAQHVENGTSGRAGVCTGASATSGWFGAFEMGIDAYTSTTAQKVYRSVSGGLVGSASSLVRTVVGIYHPSSIVAITRVTILPGGGTNFVAGSRLTLYGVL